MTAEQLNDNTAGYPSCPPPPATPRRNHAVLGWCALAALVVLVIVGSALRGAAPAQPAASPAAADLTTQDTQYLTLLNKYGLPYRTADAAIEVGHNTAILYNNGWSLKQIVYYNQAAAQRARVAYTAAELDYLTSAAVSCYATNPSPTDPKLQGFCTR